MRTEAHSRGGRRIAIYIGGGVLIVLIAGVIAGWDEISWRYRRWDLLRSSPETWKEFRGNLYRLTPSGCTWYEGEEYAREIGGHLVAINDAEEQEWVVDTFGSDAMWIGCTDEDSEGEWRWTSGEELAFTNWLPGEPNNEQAGEPFGMINFRQRGRWNDLGDSAAEWGRIRGIVELSGPRRRR